jgi:Cyclic nucleotide-binding domain
VLRVVWANRELRRVEFAFATFNSGELATWLALLVYAYAQGGVAETGVVATAMLVPAALLAPVLAALGERYPPGKALLAGYLAEALTCGAVGAAMLTQVRPSVVYVVVVANVVAFTMTRPTQAAFAPGLARGPEELVATNVASNWIESLSILVAPALGGAVLGVASPGWVFALMAVACGLGALLVWPLRNAVAAPLRDRDREEHEDGGSSVGGSIAFVARDPQARTLVLLLGAQFVALGALDVLYVQLAISVLHRGGSWAGYLSAAFGAGGVLAVWVTARLVGLARLAWPLVLSVAVWSIALVGVAAIPGVLAALAGLALAGGARATFDVTGRTLLQRVARPDLLARVFGLLEGLQMAGLAAGCLLAPALVKVGGTTTALIGVGAVLPLLAAATGPRLLDIDRHATVPVVEIALLRSVPLFALLPPPTLESLARALLPVTVPAGQDVIRQGDEGDLFYAIADGELDVIADSRTITTLGRGNYFGEIALMYDVPRTATVRTRSQSRLYTLDRETFLVAITGSTSSDTRAQGLADERLAELRAHQEATAGLTP